MDVEANLISRSMLDGTPVPALEAKVTEEFFQDKEHREVWRWIVGYWLEHSEMPTAKALKHVFSGYRLINSTEPISFYISEMRTEHKRRLTYDGVGQAVALFQRGEVDQTLSVLSSLVMAVNTQVSFLKDTDLTQTGNDRIQMYEAWTAQGGKGLRGIDTGYDIVNKATSGWQKQQLITLIGPPKSMKSTNMMKMAIIAHERGFVPMFVSFEMSEEEQALRHDFLRAGVSYQRLIHGRLTDDDFLKLRREANRQKDMHEFIMSTDISAATTVSALRAKITRYTPDIVFVDGVYLMDSENPAHEPGSAFALTDITRGMKRMAQDLEIPIVQSTQVLESRYSKRSGLTLRGIGYTSSFAQDSDVVMGTEKMDDHGLIRVSIVDSRNAGSGITQLVKVDWDRGEIHEVDEADDDEGAFFAPAPDV